MLIAILLIQTTIWEEFGYLRHTTNLTVYKGIVEETKGLTTQFPLSHMRMLLGADLAHIKVLLTTLDLHHRQARSINVLGTALKVIAGTPDFDDFVNLKFRQQELVDSERHQVEINTRIQEKINKLTETVHHIIKNSKAGQIDTGHLY
uniref:Retrovirus-related Env polyprotein from transposon gypsy n=1 Tax=Bactrocera latifrons TaxID=174628 RepID=A0A0K8TYI4_BACLA